MVQRYHIRLKVQAISCHNESQGVKETQDEGEPIRANCWHIVQNKFWWYTIEMRRWKSIPRTDQIIPRWNMWWTLFTYCNHPQNNQSMILLAINLQRLVCHKKEMFVMSTIFRKNEESCDAFAADFGGKTIVLMGTWCCWAH